MKEGIFEELKNSIKQGGAILRGEIAPSRSFDIDNPDVKAIREQYGLSQDRFGDIISN